MSIVHYETRLSIFNVIKAHFKSYVCKAISALGDDAAYVRLDGTSIPDPPFDVYFVNATHNSVMLAWRPGFDGGSQQRFQVRYMEVGELAYKYEDVVPPSAIIYNVQGLKIQKEYDFTVKGINNLEGKFSTPAIRARTGVAPPEGRYQSRDDIPLIIILTVSIVGMILLGLNILLILFFIRRRRMKMEKNASEGASQANTVEMFSVPTITEDSKSCTTGDRRSLDDFDYRAYDRKLYKMYSCTVPRVEFERLIVTSA